MQVRGEERLVPSFVMMTRLRAWHLTIDSSRLTLC
jgi:hypothetical protein